MLVRIIKTDERRDVSPAEALRLIETKQAVPVLRREVKTAVIPETRVEQR